MGGTRSVREERGSENGTEHIAGKCPGEFFRPGVSREDGTFEGGERQQVEGLHLEVTFDVEGGLLYRRAREEGLQPGKVVDRLPGIRQGECVVGPGWDVLQDFLRLGGIPLE